MTNSSMLGGIFRKRGEEANGVPVQQPAPNEGTSPPNTNPVSRPTGAQVSKEQVAARSTELSAAFGKITAVLMRTPEYHQMRLSDLEWLVVPAVATRQFLIAEAQKATGLTVPVSVVLWATVSDTVDQRLSSNVGELIRLKAEDWKSGSIPWLVAAAGEPRAVAGLLKVVAERQFGASGIKAIAQGADGKAVVTNLHKTTVAATPGATRPN